MSVRMRERERDEIMKNIHQGHLVYGTERLTKERKERERERESELSVMVLHDKRWLFLTAWLNQ